MQTLDMPHFAQTELLQVSLSPLARKHLPHTPGSPATHQGCSSCQKLGRSPGTPDVLAPAS